MKLISRDVLEGGVMYYTVIADGGLNQLMISEKIKRIDEWLKEHIDSARYHTVGASVFFKYPEDRSAFLLRWTGE